MFPCFRNSPNKLPLKALVFANGLAHLLKQMGEPKQYNVDLCKVKKKKRIPFVISRPMYCIHSRYSDDAG